jgi:protein CpxP
MKKLIFGALLLGAFVGNAQEKKQKPEGGRGHKTEKVTPEDQSKQLASELKLDAKQQEKVKALYADQEKKRAQLKPEAGKKTEGEKPNREEFETKMKKENEEFDGKMKGILTADQYTAWKKSQKQQPAQAGTGKKPAKQKKS